MTLRRLWDPFRELDSLRRHIDAAYQDYYGRPSWPRLNISVDDDNVYVEALAPGLDAESINVEIMKNTLTITGERKAFNDADDKAKAVRRERVVGRFTRAVSLPVEVDSKKASADYKSGILYITLSKAEAAKPKRITVSVN